jgi:hypothetical protein
MGDFSPYVEAGAGEIGMKLKRARTLAPVSLNGRVPGEVLRDPRRERRVRPRGARQGNQRAATSRLHGACVRERGPSFQAWRRQAVGGLTWTPPGPKKGPGWSRGMGRNGTGVVLLQDKEQFRVPRKPPIFRGHARNTPTPRCSASLLRAGACSSHWSTLKAAAIALRLGLGLNVSRSVPSGVWTEGGRYPGVRGRSWWPVYPLPSSPWADRDVQNEDDSRGCPVL